MSGGGIGGATSETVPEPRTVDIASAFTYSKKKTD